MATSSIFSNIIINNNESAEKLVDAMEKAVECSENISSKQPSYRYPNVDELQDILFVAEK